jgi:hypothetical protein
MTVRHTFDAATLLKDAGAITSSAAAQVGGAARIIDVGDVEVRGDLVLEVSAMDIVGNDEFYEIVLQGSPDDDFGTAGNIQDIAVVQLAAKEKKRTDSDKDDVVGRYVVPVSNRFNETNYRYLRLYTVVTVDAATGSINYLGFLTKS